MAQWLKTLTGCLCILTVLMHLIPKGKFSAYVRFYGGFLFFLVASGPLWKLLAGEGELERILQLAFLRDGYYDLESSIDGMAELKNEQIKVAYQNELVRQIREIASAYGIVASEIQVSFGGEDGYQMTGVSFSVRAAGSDWEDSPQDQSMQEYSGSVPDKGYGGSVSGIEYGGRGVGLDGSVPEIEYGGNVTGMEYGGSVPGMEHGDSASAMDRAGSGADMDRAVEAVKEELAGTFMLDPDAIRVRREGTG